jgi:hypothetical protein
MLVLLVLALSGLPAGAVLCDLVFCAPITTAGCHEHGTAPVDGMLVSAVDACSHLALVRPFVPEHRHARSGAGPAVLEMPPCDVLVAQWRTAVRTTHAPPPRDLSPRVLPLRI